MDGPLQGGVPVLAWTLPGERPRAGAVIVGADVPWRVRALSGQTSWSGRGRCWGRRSRVGADMARADAGGRSGVESVIAGVDIPG